MMAILCMTWLEIMRKRVFVVTILMTVCFMVLFGLVVHASTSRLDGSADLMGRYALGSLVITMGLYVASFMISYLSIFSSAGTISAEIDNGLLLSILPRPVPRWRIYLGKWLGYATWAVAYCAIIFCVVILTVHVILHFPLVAHACWQALLVFELVPLTLVSLSVLGSVYLPALGNGIAVTLLFGLGLIGGFAQRLGIPSAQTSLNQIGLVTSLIVPTNATYYRMLADMLDSKDIPLGGLSSTLGPFAGGPTPSNAFLVYVILYIAVMLCLGMWRFSRRDV